MIAVGERTKNFSARLIHVGMWLWQVLRFQNPEKVYNHWLIVFEGIQYEATDHGVIKNNRKLSGDTVSYRILVDKRAGDYLREQVDKKYEYANFLFHTLKIIFPKWLGNKTDRKHSCVELVTRTLRASGYSIKTWSNPVELKNWFDEDDFAKMLNIKGF